MALRQIRDKGRLRSAADGARLDADVTGVEQAFARNGLGDRTIMRPNMEEFVELSEEVGRLKTLAEGTESRQSEMLKAIAQQRDANSDDRSSSDSD